MLAGQLAIYDRSDHLASSYSDSLLRVKGSVFPISARALSMALFVANKAEQLIQRGGSPAAAEITRVSSGSSNSSAPDS